MGVPVWTIDGSYLGSRLRRLRPRHGLESVIAAARFCLSRAYRSAVLVQLLRPKDLHQISTLTALDRYPEIFEACRVHLAGRDDLRLLSFGCSTGEEVVTLRRLFPSARITGAEINPHALAACRRRVVDERVEFVESTQSAIEKRAPFDAIFCMAVLQRSPHFVVSQQLANIGSLYPFSKFEAQVTAFDGWLGGGGMLVLHHTQYVFEDLALSARYRPLPLVGCKLVSGPRFDRHGNRRLDSSFDSIFVRMNNG